MFQLLTEMLLLLKVVGAILGDILLAVVVIACLMLAFTIACVCYREIFVTSA